MTRMFGIGMPELVIIFVIALLVFGPKELPKIGKTIGKAMGEFRRASDELKEGIQREIDLAEREQSEGASTSTTSDTGSDTVPTESPTASAGTPPEPQLELPISGASAPSGMAATPTEGSAADSKTGAVDSPITPTDRVEPAPSTSAPETASPAPPASKPPETTHV